MNHHIAGDEDKQYYAHALERLTPHAIDNPLGGPRAQDYGDSHQSGKEPELALKTDISLINQGSLRPCMTGAVVASLAI